MKRANLAIESKAVLSLGDYLLVQRGNYFYLYHKGENNEFELIRKDSIHHVHLTHLTSDPSNLNVRYLKTQNDIELCIKGGFFNTIMGNSIREFLIESSILRRTYGHYRN